MSTCTSGNIFDRFNKLASLYPDSEALRFPRSSKSTSYRELLSITNQICNSLLILNIRKGDVLALFHDRSEYAY